MDYCQLMGQRLGEQRFCVLPVRPFCYQQQAFLSMECHATQDTASDVSTDSLAMDHFKNAGDGTRNFNDPPSTPMLGKWIDGYHYEPMEFGYDITELTQNFDRRKPIKYFFNIII